MASLTCGERLVRCLTGGDIDRVPFGVGLGWHPWGVTLDNWRRQTGIADLDLVKAMRYDRGFTVPALESGAWPAFPEEVFAEDGEYVTYRDRRGMTLKGRKDGGSIPDFLDHPVKGVADWEELRDTRFRLDNIDSRLVQDWDVFRANLAETGEAVQVGNFPWGVFGTVRDLMGVEEMLVGFYDHPGMMRDMMERLTRIWLGIWERVADEVRIDHIHIWEDMSGRQGSLLSPAMVEEFMMPCYDRIRDFAVARGVRVVSVDTDGDCGELVPLMMCHGVNMFFPFEAQAGNDILEYRRLYPELGIMGGLDKRCLARSADAVDLEVARCAEMLRHGRYVPGFDHLIPPDAQWHLYKRVAEAVRELCDHNGGELCR